MNIKNKILLYLLFAFAFFLSPSISFASPVDDYPFSPDLIISDYEMTDYNSMTIGDIQRFLQDQGSALAWLITDDKDGYKKTASEIIYLAAQEYHINPKLLLAFLQKEQSLITLDNPSQDRIDWAMGYAVCDSCRHDDPRIQKYKGFGKQVDNAAGVLRFYYENADNYGFIKKAGEEIEIDDQKFVVKNQATANLYTYTPHIWGNKLFSYVYNKYFGNPLNHLEKDLAIYVPKTTTRIRYEASDSKDDSKNLIYRRNYKLKITKSAKNIIKVKEGETAYFWVEYQNIGNKTWKNEDLKQLYLIKKSDLDKTIIPEITDNSLFNNNAVISNKNLDLIFAGKTEVNSNGILRITIKIDPNYIKEENFDYVLVLGGHGYFPESELNFTVQRQFNYDAILISHDFPNYADEKSVHHITVKYKNVGNKIWYKNDVYLEWSNLTMNTHNYITFNENYVEPGDIATFEFTTHLQGKNLYEYSLKLYKKINAEKYNKFPTGDFFPKIAVNVDDKVSNQIENNIDIENIAISAEEYVDNTAVNNNENFNIDTNNYTYDQAIKDNSYKAELIKAQIPVGLKKSERKLAYITVKNVGTKTWTKGKMVLRSYRSINPFRGSLFYDSQSWITNMAVAKIQKNVKPGESYTFQFYIQAPDSIGTYKTYWQLEWGDLYQEVKIGNVYTRSYLIIVQD